MEHALHTFDTLQPYFRDVFYIGIAIIVIVFAYSSWCFNRLDNLLARYGSSEIINVYNKFGMNKKFQQNYESSMLMRYVRKKVFEKEKQLAIREAGSRAYISMKINLFIGFPVLAIIGIILFYCFRSH